MVHCRRKHSRYGFLYMSLIRNFWFAEDIIAIPIKALCVCVCACKRPGNENYLAKVIEDERQSYLKLLDRKGAGEVISDNGLVIDVGHYFTWRLIEWFHEYPIIIVSQSVILLFKTLFFLKQNYTSFIYYHYNNFIHSLNLVNQ